MHVLTTILVICLELCMCSGASSSDVSSDATSAEGQYITMESYQDITRHSIEAPGTYVVQIMNGCGLITVQLHMSNYTGDVVQISHFSYNLQPNPGTITVILENPVDHLNISATANTTTRTMTVTWEFSILPENYNRRILRTDAYGGCDLQRVVNFTTLKIVACPSPQTVATVNQSSSFNITANSVGHYNKTANCSCLHDDEVLFDIAGNRTIGTATCAINAEWVGCENLQCWSGPKNISVTQVNMSANAVDPFKCSSDDGFPNSEKEILKMNGKPIPDNYQLKSSDHGKNLSCQVVSPYTKKQSEIFESSPEKVVVYYKPENSTVSDDPAVIPMNSSKLLTYSVYANPLPNAGGLDVKVYNASGSASSDIFSPVDNHTDDVNHVFEFNITVRSNYDYGKYKVCASTNDPDGTDCAVFSIHSRNPLNSGLPDTIIGAIIAGVILLLVLITVAGVCLWKKRNKAPPNEENSKEEKVNELYGVAQFQAPSSKNHKKVQEVKPNVLYGSASGGASPHEDVVEYSMANDVHIGDENPASVTEQPCSSNTEVYAQIDRQKGSARDGCKVEIKDEKPAGSAVTSSTEQPCSSNTEVYAQIDRQKGSASDGCKVEIQDDGPATSAVTFTTVDKSKKQKKDNVPEIYAVINKPRKRA